VFPLAQSAEKCVSGPHHQLCVVPGSSSKSAATADAFGSDALPKQMDIVVVPGF
jgi:hypothetical protein